MPMPFWQRGSVGHTGEALPRGSTAVRWKKVPSLQTELYLIIYRAHFVLWKSNRLLQVDLLGKFWENNQKMQSYFPQNYLTVSCQIFKVNYKSAKWGMEPETSFTVVFGTEQQKSDTTNNSITLIQTVFDMFSSTTGHIFLNKFSKVICLNHLELLQGELVKTQLNGLFWWVSTWKY